MIPDRPLNFRFADMTLDDLEAFYAIGSDTKQLLEYAGRFKRMLSNAGDWTAEECGRIKITELAQVFQQIREAEKGEEADAIPPPIVTHSDSTAPESEIASPAGSES